VIGGFVVMVVVFSVLEPDTFLDTNTLRTILDQAAVPLLLVCGLTFVLAVGEFDLSYTATIGLAGGLVAVLMRDQGLGVAPAIGVTLLAAVAVGVVVGLLVTIGRASSFIVTLAIGSALTGFELALTDNTTIYQGIPASFGDIASREILGLHAPVWIAGVVFAAFVVLYTARASAATPRRSAATRRPRTWPACACAVCGSSASRCSRCSPACAPSC
jgi:ribose transport system permease protein